MLVGYMRVSTDGERQVLDLHSSGRAIASWFWKLDRGQSLPHLLSTVNGLKERGVAFRSLTTQMDTATPQGEFLFHVCGALAQSNGPCPRSEFGPASRQPSVAAGGAVAR